MRKSTFFLLILALCMAVSLPVMAQDSGGVEQFTMPKKDGKQGDKTVDGSLLFYDMGGPTGNPPGYYAGYTRFVSAAEGDEITLTFNKLDLGGSAKVYVYDGDISFDKYLSPLPEGYLAELSGTQAGQSYTSTTGSLSVLYYCHGGAASGTGWEALVEAAPTKDQEWKGITATQTDLPVAYPGKSGVALMCVNMLTDGGGNPMSVTGLEFAISGSLDLSKLSNLRVAYSKGSQTPSGTTFGATYDAASATLQFAGDASLRSGNNYFWLLADVAPDATAGSTIDASLTSATVAGEQKVASAIAPEGNVTLANMVLISATPTTYNVGDAPISFYDDGGPDGNITEGFSGQATFKPSTPGRKVEIKFTALDLFTTSSVASYNDVLNVYNGSTADPANLIATVTTDLKAFHSTAADGSLTVTFASTNGYPKPGFEATVSQFTPRPMTAGEIVASHPSATNVSASATGVEMLLVNIPAEGTEPALTASSFSFTASGSAPLDAATLYYLGSSKEGVKTKVGESTAPSGSFTISLNTPVELKEHDNWFLLTYDIGALAVNGGTADAAINSVTLSGTAQTVANGNPDGERQIENIWYSTTGSATVTIAGDWKYRNTPSEYSYYGYDNTEGDQTVTFVPNTPGTVIELDFTKFSITYPSYSGPTPPSFKIYDGASAAATLLWECTKELKDKGPQKPIRATNAEGKLTVVFNSNGTRGSSSSTGFEANVIEYSPKPMTLERASAFQTNNAIIPPDATDVETIGFAITTAGDQNPISLTTVTIDMKGSQDKVKTVKIYSTGSTQEFSTAMLVGTASVDASKAEQQICFTSAQRLPEKTSYWYVAYDMASGIPAESVIDAALVSVTTSVGTLHATDGDPEGERITKNLYYMRSGNNTVTVSESLLFYDNGGPEGKYTTDVSGTVTFLPTEGKMLRMTINDFNCNWQDHLYFYNGTTVDESKLLLDRSGTTSSDLPVTFLSKDESGAITVSFAPVKNNTNRGWEILVEAFVPQPLAVAAVEVTPVHDTKMLRGSDNNSMLKVKVDITGDKGVVDIDKFAFSALDTDNDVVTAVRVWYTGTDETFKTYDLFGEALLADEMTIAGSKKYNEKGTYYYWLSYDISPDAELNSKVQARLASIGSGEQSFVPAETRDALTTVQEGIHGTFTVGTSGDCDFNTISAAVASLLPGIDGPVIFELADGNYKEVVKVPAVTGASERNTITMRSASGKRDNVVITYDYYDDPGSGNYAGRFGIFTFDGVKYFTLEGVTVTSGTYTGFPGIVFVRNVSQHCTVSDCVISSPTSTDSSRGTTLVNMYAVNEANSNSDYFTLEDSHLEGGYIGISLQGTSHADLPKQTGGHIVGNTFVNQGSKAVYLNGENNAVVQRNSTISDSQTTTSSYYAFDLSEFDGNMDVSGNTIYMDTPKGSATGMYVRMYTPEKRAPGTRRIYNNEINLVNTSTAVTGIRVNNEIPALEIVNNTISIEPAADATAAATGIFIGGNMTTGQISNNIVQNMTQGDALHVNRDTYLPELSFNTNVLYTVNPDKLVYVGGNGSGNVGLDAWKTLGYDATSVYEHTDFLSAKVLEPEQQGSLLNGTPVDYVTTDLYGAPRDAQHPTIGAYEYAESTVAPVMAEGYPAVKSVGHVTAEVAVKSSLTSSISYLVLPASDPAPDAATVAASELKADVRKGVEAILNIEGLEPKTDYRLYALLTSLRDMQSESLATVGFTTTYRPTEVATFEDATVLDSRIEDGTFSFTGFEITDITDGVEPQPNAKAAAVSDGYAVVKLTNADNLTIDGFYVKNSSEVAVTVMDDLLAPKGTKQIPAHDTWTYVDLRDMGTLTYVEFETEGDMMIDNFGGQPQPLVLSVTLDADTPVAEGTEVSLASVVSGGVAPFTYVWTDASASELGTEGVLTLAPEHSAIYFLTVTDAWGNKASARKEMRVSGAQYVATFDDLHLEPESNWHGYTDDPEYTTGSFFSGSFEFNNSYIADWGSWSFFGYSNCTSTEFSSYVTDQYNSAVGHGAADSDNYGVVFVSDWQGNTEMTLSNSAAGQTVDGMWITNSAWAVDAIVNGDGMEGKFEKDDWFKLTLTGYDAEGTATEAEYYLADYRADDERDRWYLDSWQWIDLKPLGDVVKVRFALSSTKNNTYGMTTPSYVCIDNVGAPRDITRTPTQILAVNDETPSAVVDLARFFSFDAEEATVTYTLEGTSEYAAIEGSMLTVTAPSDAEFTLIIEAFQRGKREYVEMPVRMSLKSGIDAVQLDGAAVYPNPASDYFNVSAPCGAFTAEVISTDGITVCRTASEDGKVRIDASSMQPGAYIVRIASVADGAVAVKKLLIVR